MKGQHQDCALALFAEWNAVSGLILTLTVSRAQNPSQLIHIMSLPLQANGSTSFSSEGKTFFVHLFSHCGPPPSPSLLFCFPFSSLVPFGISMAMGHLCSDGQRDVPPFCLIFTPSCLSQPGAQDPFVCPSPILTESTGLLLVRA